MSLATVILAAGQGKRMKSDLPKVLHPLNGRPMVHYVVDAAKAIGSERTILIIGHKRELVREACKGLDVEFAVQAEQLGTGHAVRQTEMQLRDFEGDVLVLSGDVPLLTADTLKILVERHRAEKPLATLLNRRNGKSAWIRAYRAQQ